MIPEFFNRILDYESLSVVGMAKNVGKTVCLRALLDHHAAPEKAMCLAVTSIGMDGESTDALLRTAKPELNFYPGMWVQTSERHYALRRLTAEIADISRENTACGRLVTARVLTPGKLILSGYAHTQGLRKYIAQMHALGVRTAIIDGALSRMSLASPFVSRAMILCTGAALSKNIGDLVRKTQLQYSLMNLPVFSEPVSEDLSELKGGVYAIDAQGQVHDLQIPSLLQAHKHLDKLEPCFRAGCTLYVAGLLNDTFLRFLTGKNPRPDVVVSDFSKLFVSRQVFEAFTRSGSRLGVLQQPEILGVCVNPFSPEGYTLDSSELQGRMSEALQREVYDILG